MRVIAGSARRLTLVTPKGYSTRPTSDKVKETLFNILAPDLYDVNFLDLFAGSGGIGIEALSRGARKATFIDKDKASVDCIRRNIATTHFENKARVIPFDVLSSLYNLDMKEPFDIIFMDPPYNEELEKQVLAILVKLPIVTEDTMIIVESSIETDFDYLEEIGLYAYRVKEYKNNKHTFIRKAD